MGRDTLARPDPRWTPTCPFEIFLEASQSKPGRRFSFSFSIRYGHTPQRANVKERTDHERQTRLRKREKNHNIKAWPKWQDQSYPCLLRHRRLATERSLRVSLCSVVTGAKKSGVGVRCVVEDHVLGPNGLVLAAVLEGFDRHFPWFDPRPTVLAGTQPIRPSRKA